MKKTIAQELGIQDFPFIIKDKYGDIIYKEDDSGQWVKTKYNAASQIIFREFSTGKWVEKKFDDFGNLVFKRDSEGYWEKREYDRFGDRVYFENSKGEIYDDRTNSNN